MSSKVIVTDKISSSLLGKASKENLVSYNFSSDKLRNDPRIDLRSSRATQHALSLLILFDKIIIPIIGDNFKIPRLEDDGIVEFVSYDMGKSEIASEEPILETLCDYDWVKPFVLNSLMKNKKMKECKRNSSFIYQDSWVVLVAKLMNQ